MSVNLESIAKQKQPTSFAIKYLEYAGRTYTACIKSIHHFLKACQWEFLANLIATLCIEPISTIQSAQLLQRGLKGEKYSYLNPKKLSEEQLKLPPLLLIHGDQSNSGLFEPFVDFCSQEKLKAPIFTIDLKSKDGLVSEKHLDVLTDKVKQIIGLYPANHAPKITLIGHSSGGDVIPPLAKKMEKEGLIAAPLIKIGSVLKQGEADKWNQYPHGTILEIVGLRDIFEGCDTKLKNKLVLNLGHLGLLFDQRVFKKILSEIRGGYSG